MSFRLSFVVMVLLPFAVAAVVLGAQAKAPDRAEVLATKLQRYYDRLTDFEAEFVQKYTRVALSRTTESRGHVFLRKPGKMRWAYRKPQEKLFVSDGERLFVYEPDPEYPQVIVTQDFRSSRFSRSLGFLWGEGKLRDSFSVKIDPKDSALFPGSSDILTLVPEEDPSFRRLVLALDPKTAHITGAVLYETSGNTNRFDFKDPKINKGLSAKTFQFTPPEGVEIIRQ